MLLAFFHHFRVKIHQEWEKFKLCFEFAANYVTLLLLCLGQKIMPRTTKLPGPHTSGILEISCRSLLVQDFINIQEVICPGCIVLLDHAYQDLTFQ